MSRGANRHDLVVVTVNNQRWQVELFEVRGEVSFRERPDAVKFVLEAALYALKPERVTDTLADLRARPVGTVERYRQILKELRTVSCDSSADAVEYFKRQAAWIGVRLEHQRRHC